MAGCVKPTRRIEVISELLEKQRLCAARD